MTTMMRLLFGGTGSAGMGAEGGAADRRRPSWAGGGDGISIIFNIHWLLAWRVEGGWAAK